VSEQHAERAHQVRPFELLFDLVFVFAFTQVTTVLSDDPTWRGLGHGALILAALWWAWAAYAWLTNTLDPDEGAVWGAMLVAMAAMFVAALAVPEVFGRHGVLFGVAFLIVNVMHLALYALGARDDRDLLAAILRIAPLALAGAALIIAAGFVHGTLRPLLWLAALVVGLFGPLFSSLSGWRVQPAHFIERHGLIVIIVLFAFAMKATLAHVGDTLDTIPAIGLCGGPALYLFAYVGLRLRVARTVGGGRLLAAVACALLFPVAVVVPALAALALVAAVWVTLHAYEIIWWREARAQTRALRASASAP
jgi:low temperature requirement protein LtrA